MTRMTRPRRYHVALLLLSLTLAGCAFTYIPLLRQPNVPTPRLYVAEQSALKQTNRGLELTLGLETVPQADWLAVQWFDPANNEVYATSLWLEPAPSLQTIATRLPPRVALEDGLWRAVVSYQGILERQFSATVRAP